MCHHQTCCRICKYFFQNVFFLVMHTLRIISPLQNSCRQLQTFNGHNILSMGSECQKCLKCHTYYNLVYYCHYCSNSLKSREIKCEEVSCYAVKVCGKLSLVTNDLLGCLIWTVITRQGNISDSLSSGASGVLSNNVPMC